MLQWLARRKLTSEDRATVIRALKTLEASRDAKGLVIALGAEVPEDAYCTAVSDEAAWALARLGSLAVDSLTSALADPKPKVRRLAARTLGTIGDPRAIPPLVELLGATDPAQAECAAFALARFGNARAGDTLLAVVTTGWCRAPEHRLMEAVSALARLRDPRAIEPLQQLLPKVGHADLGGVADAMSALGAPPVDFLAKRLSDRDEDMRRAAVQALGNSRNAAAVEPLIAALSDPSGLVRDYAAEALGKLGDRRAVEPLLAYFETDPLLGDRAVRALGMIGDARAVGALLQHVYVPYFDMLPRAVAEALPRILGASGAAVRSDLLRRIVSLVDSDESWREDGSDAQGFRIDERRTYRVNFSDARDAARAELVRRGEAVEGE